MTRSGPVMRQLGLIAEVIVEDYVNDRPSFS